MMYFYIMIMFVVENSIKEICSDNCRIYSKGFIDFIEIYLWLINFSLRDCFRNGNCWWSCKEFRGLLINLIFRLWYDYEK